MNDYWLTCKKQTKAAINCNRRCDSCGWNPDEKERRLREGVLRPAFETRFGRITEVRHLTFKPRAKEEKT